MLDPLSLLIYPLKLVIFASIFTKIKTYYIFVQKFNFLHFLEQSAKIKAET